jgi:2-amino-4-hydroxy-6-hydroxymethyldihydropteridine diphosphokinase
MKMNRFIILISSNVDAARNMQAARALLRKTFPGILFSDNLESKTVVHENQLLPAGYPEVYLNAVASGETTVTVEDMQIFLKQSETTLGRNRAQRSKGLVAIDLDLVEWNKETLRPKDAAQSYYQACLVSLDYSFGAG